MTLSPFYAAICCSIFLTNFIRAEVDFAHQVLPILKDRCAKCHSDGKYKGGLSLDTREALLSSDAVVVGKASESLLIELLSAADPDDRMPQKADPLSAEQINILTRWVDEGLAWEPGFTFKNATWKAPIAHRKPELPAAKTPGEPAIDRIVRAYFAENKIASPGTISDAIFLRRVHLDLIGILPTVPELQEFESSTSPDKRGEKIDELLARDIDYADHWMTFWNDLLRNDYAGTGYIDGGRKQISAWLYQSLQENKPYDQFVRELMNPSAESEGFIKGIKWRGSVNASQVQEIQYAQSVSQVFFGENMKCASCHDSFINDWKLADAYGMAAIYAGKPLEMFRCDKATGKVADAKFLFDSLGEIDRKASRGEQLKRAAELSTSEGNGRLARTIVNRLWARLMGHGLVEPVDIMGNRPWNEDLLDHLGWDLAHNGYDLKRSLGLIAKSGSYQSATVPPPGPTKEYVFTGPIAKRMTAEQFIDAVWEITATAPGKIEAAVTRGISESATPLPGKWIWSADGNRPAGETVTFTRTFDLPEIAPAELLITCDNQYTLRVNGKQLGGDDNWEDIEKYDLAGVLKPGANTIQVEGKNLGGGPNAASLFVCISIRSAGELINITTDKQWQADGKPAVELGAEPWETRVGSQIQGLLPRQDESEAPSYRAVRASLVKSTVLMRALGRPNREQIVTTRPADLTTLQALELNNGAEFVSYLNHGASTLAGQSENLVDHLYLNALCRTPTTSEKAVAAEILGSPITKDRIADLLWTVLMLPEFQFVN